MSEEFIPPDIPEPQDPPDIPGADPVVMVEFAHYDLATGEIIAVGRCNEANLAANSALYPALGFITGPPATPETDRVDILEDPPVIIARPVPPIVTDKTSITADGSDAATISGIPAGTLVTLQAANDFEEASQTVTGTTTLTTLHRVPHVLVFENFPYQRKELTINGV